MTSNIIMFPDKKENQKQEGLNLGKKLLQKAYPFDGKNTGKKMNAKRYPPDHKFFINDIPVDEPKNRFDYLELCKRFLAEEPYREVLCAISDREYYEKVHPKLQNLVNNYYAFRS